MFEKSIYGQDGYYKLSAKKSGETSINLSNEIANFIKGNSNREQIVSFTIYLEDYYKALGYIVNKLPLYVSTSKSSSEEMYSDAFFQKTFATINAFFGGESEKQYQVNLLSREDGRFYLNKLEYNGFNVRKFLIAGHSKLIFDKINDKLVLRLVSGDLSDGEESTTTSSQPLSTLNPTSLNSFNQQLLTAIRTKPFVLLAGISGTGKSRIVRELAKACWDNDEDRKKLKNFKMIQVRPNWHDSSEVLGYVSRISGEEYIIGDFLRAVAEAWQDTSRPYFVCLDEMNLAPVEQYFAEYLSVFESRRFEDGDWKTDCIVPMQVEQWYVDMVHKLVGDKENLRNQFLKNGISIPPNLVVIGTVNMDETTYSFSRKVLDRAMTIEMNDVDLKAGISGNPKENDFSGILLSEGDVLAPKKSVDDMISDNPEVCDRVVEYLSDINGILAKTPFRIAFRTRNEAILYVLNMLDLRKEEISGNDAKKDEIIASALDEITMMKILSRIEGDESKISKEKLGKLREKTGKKCKDKLDYMIPRLDSGFTSFWE